MKVAERMALCEEIEHILHDNPTIDNLIDASHKLDDLIEAEYAAKALRDARGGR